jgi:acyl-CoA reductase-like NAD-dependent aldehyde dehydrogenase
MAGVRPLRIGSDRVTTAEEIVVVSPFDGHEIGRVPSCGPEQVDDAVTAATAVRAAGPLPAWQRAEILDAAARLLNERVEDFARTIAEEAAKPIKTARIEAARAVSTFTFSAAVARGLTGEMIPMDAADVGEGKLAFTLRVPIGVVGAISPFNFPLNLVAHKVAPAIAAGCPIVLKPASQTPLSALALADLLIDECGLPAGHLNVVTGGGGTVGNAIVEHDGIAMITFTGSPPAGWGIKSRAPRKKVGLELGNNAPVIIEPDADVAVAAAKISVAGFSHAGQSCISTQRVLVHEDVADTLLGELVPKVEALKVGDPLDESTDVSALISASERDRVKEWIDEAVAGGAEVACGGEVRDGVLAATILTNVTPDMKVCALEVFGPVIGVQTYRDLDTALSIANDTHYGLQAAIFTADLATALRAVHTLDFGGVLVNEVPTYRADQMPYGGLRDSGNTREGPKYAAHEMTETRLVVIQA